MNDNERGTDIVIDALEKNPEMVSYLSSIKNSRRKKQKLVDEIAEATARPILNKRYSNLITEFVVNVLRIRNKFD